MIIKKLKEKKANTKSAENGPREHHSHPFSQDISGKLAAPHLQEAYENCLATSPAKMKGKTSCSYAYSCARAAFMAKLWNTQINFKRK